MIKGYSNPKIVKLLHVHECTIKVHVSHILYKMGVKNRIQAAVKAVKIM